MSTPTPDLVARLRAVGIELAQVEESFIHSGGAGGQNVNKVATCVVLKVAVRQVAIKMQEHRTQGANRAAAWRLLVERLEAARARQMALRQAAREKARRQKAGRPRGVKKQFVQLKRRRAATRAGRQIAEEE